MEQKRGLVDMAPLKEFAATKLPSGSVARELIISENEEIPSSEFLVKVNIWLGLVRRELER